MANLNKVMLIGRLTRDPEIRSFASGGRVAAFGFAVNNYKKNQQTGQWDAEPVFIDCDAFNRGDFGKLADRVERFLHKGSQVYLEGRLKLDQWDDKTTGQKRSKLKLVVDSMELLDGRPQDGSNGAPMRSSAPASQGQGSAMDSPPSDYHDAPAEAPSGGQDGDIPF
jgi:single-strand DNA-binding protein